MAGDIDDYKYTLDSDLGDADEGREESNPKEPALEGNLEERCGGRYYHLICTHVQSINESR